MMRVVLAAALVGLVAGTNIIGYDGRETSGLRHKRHHPKHKKQTKLHAIRKVL